MRVRVSGALALAASLSVVALGGFGAPGVGAQTDDFSQTFQFTGELEPFDVPAGICTVTVDAWGAQAGDQGLTIGLNISNGRPEALGGHTTTVVSVPSGATLWVSVGELGGNGQVGIDAGGVPSAVGGQGGWPDGGNGKGATGETLNSIVAAAGGGGGGSSDVRVGGTGLSNRVVAAGGGGAGSAQAILIGTSGASFTRHGGEGGGLTGNPGEVVEDSRVVSAAVSAAGGGTQLAGGAAGTPGGSPGQFGAGGDGGVAVTPQNDAFVAVAVGGGGGGGWYGGGGGAAGVTTSAAAATTVTASSGGGGGGSGFGPPGSVFETGVRAGNGEVTIAYNAATDTCPPPRRDHDDDDPSDVSPAPTATPATEVVAEARFTG